MTDDKDPPVERRASWWKGQLSLPNVIAVGLLVVSLVTWSNGKDFTDRRQDEDIKAIREQAKEDRAIYARRDLLGQQLDAITEQLEKLDKKVDGITKAVR